MLIVLCKLIVIAGCAVLNWIGGYAWHNARRFIMPVVLAAAISLFSHVWWLGLTVLPLIGVLCIGYGEHSILEQILFDFWARIVWWLMATIVLGLGMCIAGHLAWFIYIPYCLGISLVGGILRKVNEIIGDLVIGALFASIILFIGA